MLRSGGVVALPTETVYGIASSAESSEGIEKLYRVKGRRKTKPIAICLNEVDDIDRCGRESGREECNKNKFLVILVPPGETIKLVALTKLLTTNRN